MPNPDGPEEGLRNPYSNRVGIDVARFKGINRQSDAGAIGDDQFWTIQNARVDGTGIKNRPGLEQIFTNAMDSCIYGIWDDRNPNDDGNAIFDANREGYGPELWPDPLQPTSGVVGRIVGHFNGQPIYVDDAGSGFLFSYTTDSEGLPTFTTTEVFEYTSTLGDPRVLGAVEFQGSLYFVVTENDGTYNEIWQWTGGAEAVLIAGDGTIPNSAYANIVTDGSDVYYAGQDPGPGEGIILKMNDGAWDSLDLPMEAGNWTPTGWYGVSRPPYVYMTGFDADAANADKVMITLQVLGETVTVANNTVPTWSGSINNWGILAALGGYLYMVGNTTQGADNFSLYRLNGSSTAEAIADLTAQLEIASQPSECLLQLYAWRNQLYASLPTSGAEGVFAKSSVDDVGVWSEITGDSVTNLNVDGYPIFSA